MTSRRDFLGILAAAPVVAPVVVKEMAAAANPPTFGYENLLQGAEWKFYPGTMEMVEIDPAADYFVGYANDVAVRNNYEISHWRGEDGEKISSVGNVKLPLNAIPNRLYGAQINADGEAI